MMSQEGANNRQLDWHNVGAAQPDEIGRLQGSLGAQLRAQGTLSCLSASYLPVAVLDLTR
jgi:hypothetical protein